MAYCVDCVALKIPSENQGHTAGSDAHIIAVV